jgi:hypothetical protein
MTTDVNALVTIASGHTAPQQYFQRRKSLHPLGERVESFLEELTFQLRLIG